MNTRSQINKKRKEKAVDPKYSNFEAVRVFTLLVEQLGYVMGCFASISA